MTTTGPFGLAHCAAVRGPVDNAVSAPVLRLILTATAAAEGAGDQEKDGEHRKEDDGDLVMMAEEERQGNHRDDGNKQLGRVADEEVPPETPEGPATAAERLHCVALPDTGESDAAATCGRTIRNHAIEPTVTRKNRPIKATIARSLPGQ